MVTHCSGPGSSTQVGKKTARQFHQCLRDFLLISLVFPLCPRYALWDCSLTFLEILYTPTDYRFRSCTDYRSERSVFRVSIRSKSANDAQLTLDGALYICGGTRSDSGTKPYFPDRNPWLGHRNRWTRHYRYHLELPVDDLALFLDYATR